MHCLRVSKRCRRRIRGRVVKMRRLVAGGTRGAARLGGALAVGRKSMGLVAIALGACGVAACGEPSDAEPPGGFAQCVHVTTDEVRRKDSDVLPTGRCQTPQPTCNLVVREPCPCEVQVPRKFYACSCKVGVWSCEVTSEDSGLCPIGTPTCHPGDSGSDAADSG